MVTGTVRGWAELQHYKDRAPPWIKLHRKLIDNYDFCCLPVASKALAPLIWLLAAETNDGTVNLDPEWLAFRLRWDIHTVREGLTPLIDKGFLDVASGVLADCYQPDTPETETEGEGETEKEAKASLSAKADVPQCPHDEILALYHETLPSNPRIKVWDGARADALRARWREDPKRQTLDYWRRFFAKVAASAFLTGRAEGQGGRPFLPGLDWMVKAANFAKIIEGRYDDRRHA